MTRKIGLPAVAGLTVLLASGALFAAAQSEQRQGATQQGTAQQGTAQQGTIQQGTAVQAIAVSPVNDTGAVRRPPSGVMQMSIAECEGLGGKVAPVSQKTCPWTAQACFTADKDGVIRSSCITMAP